MNNKIEIPKSILKENEKYACKSTKKERRKKLQKFADLATLRLGKTKVLVGICLKECANKDIKCNVCYKWSELKPIKQKT